MSVTQPVNYILIIWKVLHYKKIHFAHFNSNHKCVSMNKGAHLA